MTRLAVKEDEWVAAVGDLLDAFGWRWHDTYPTRRTLGRWSSEDAARGIPDLIAMRPPRVVFIETKTESGRLRPEQESWIEGLRLSGQEAYVVTLPGDYVFLQDLLQPETEQLTLTGTTGAATWTPLSDKENL
jgi:hypothetical protein